MKVLVIEDSRAQALYIQRMLEAEGHTITLAENLASARNLARTGDFEVYLVDRFLPDGDGLDLIREIRSAGDQTPALIVTTMGELEARLEGLRSGADDYITKPYSVEELVLRLGRFSRVTSTETAVLEADPIRMDSSAHRVWVGDQEVTLTATEFALLHLLVSAQGRVWRMPEILEQVWGLRHDPGTNRVAVYIRHLRNKIGDQLIHTVRGVGYVFDPERAS